MQKLTTTCSIILLVVFAGAFGAKNNWLINSKSKKPVTERVRTIPLYPKIKFEGVPEVSVHGNFITLFDRLHNRAVLAKLDSKADTVRQFWDLKGTQFPYKQLLRKTKYNPLVYEQLLPQLVKNGDASPWILASFAKDSALYLLIEFILPKVLDDKNKYLAEPVYFIYTRNYFNGHKDLTLIDLNPYNDQIKKNYTLHSGKPFFTLGERVFLTLEDTTSKKNTVNQLSEWSKTSNGNYEFKNSDTLVYHAGEYKTLHLDSIKIGINKRYLFSTNASLVYDYKLKEKIPIKTVTLFHAATLQDIKQKNEQLLLLVNKKKTLDAMIYDRSLEQIFGQIAFHLPPDCLFSSAKFCGESLLSILSADKKKIHLVKLEQ